MQILNADDLEIKRLDRSHEAEVREIFVDGLSERFSFNGPFTGDTEDLTRDAMCALDGGQSFLMGGFLDGVLAGVVPCSIRGNGKTLEMHIHLTRSFRGRALASGFVRRVARGLKEEGFNPFIWGPAEHRVAKTVYLNAGFREVAILPAAWDLGDGKRCDVGVAVWGGE